jgi:alpha-tubulin suppressor-like RCC1 family protein
MKLRLLVISLAIGAGLAGCGGGTSDDEARGSAQARQQIASAVERAPRAVAAAAGRGAAAAAAALDPAAQASQLFDFAEANFPQYFPSHRPDMDAPGWRYRHYPETGTYLIVADGRVYVLGGPLGPDVTYVGLAQDILNPPPNAVAAVTTPASGKTAWNIATAAQFTLTDTSGLAMAGPFTCSSDAPVEIEVAADCSTVTGRRLGTHTISVAKGGLVGKAAIKVIPQGQPIGTGPLANYNVVAMPDGRALAWGSSDAPLGQGKWTSPAVGAFLPLPVKNTAGDGVLSGVVAVAAGEYTAFALTEDGELYSWGGSRALGRVAGNGDPLPAKVLDPTGLAPLKRIVSVAGGSANAIALADDGTVYTWGAYTGRPGSDPKTYPGAVANLPGQVAGISAGNSWNAVLLMDGRVVTWGYNGDGATGQGSSSGGELTQGFVLDNLTGQPISGVVAISAGYLHGFARTATGHAYGWGRNTYGTLAQGTGSSSFNKAVLVTAPGGAAAWGGLRMIVAGGNQSLAIDQTGQVYSWGLSQNGELGDGPDHPRDNGSSLPAAVLSPTGVGALSGAVAIGASFDHSLAVGADGRLFIWGSGSGGKLGQGGSSTSLSYMARAVKDEAGTGTLDLGPMGHWPNLTRRGAL